MTLTKDEREAVIAMLRDATNQQLVDIRQQSMPVTTDQAGELRRRAYLKLVRDEMVRRAMLPRM
jgi:hypothetical protein